MYDDPVYISNQELLIHTLIIGGIILLAWISHRKKESKH
jgi:hypothetical protein